MTRYGMTATEMEKFCCPYHHMGEKLGCNNFQDLCFVDFIRYFHLYTCSVLISIHNGPY